jgi:hypothetical protein
MPRSYEPVPKKCFRLAADPGVRIFRYPMGATLHLKSILTFDKYIYKRTSTDLVGDLGY